MTVHRIDANASADPPGGSGLQRLCWCSFLLFTAVMCDPGAEASEVLVGNAAVWKYLFSDQSPPGDWKSRTFDDSSWESGRSPFGYGNKNQETHVGPKSGVKTYPITTWYRHEFKVSSTAPIRGLWLTLERDDGAVVHLNGVEVVRSNMPLGEILPLTRSLSGINDKEKRREHAHFVDASVLRRGVNVLAVEVHQKNLEGTDLWFTLRLETRSRNDPVRVVRGPYVQTTTPTQAVLRWRTDVPTESEARIGLQPGELSRKESAVGLRVEHEITLSGLEPATRYFYAVGFAGQSLAGGDDPHWFRTHPPAGEARPLRVWALGDSGTADDRPGKVRDAYLQFAAGEMPDVWLMLGDNAYMSGTDEEYQHAVFDMYPAVMLCTPLWPTIGNHDAVQTSSGDQLGTYFDIFTLPRAAEAGGVASGTEAYYSFDFANVHFICLDSQDSPRRPPSAMLTWLEHDLEATVANWIIAYFHHPPYSKGSHDSDALIDSQGRLIEMRQFVLPVLEQGGVDLVLTGHSHSYERSFLLDGHYGFSSTLEDSMILDHGDGREHCDGAYEKKGDGPEPHAGAVYVVAGSSGQVSNGKLNHPVMVISLKELGSLVLDVDGPRLDAKFLRETGATDDQFTMVKK